MRFSTSFFLCKSNFHSRARARDIFLRIFLRSARRRSRSEDCFYFLNESPPRKNVSNNNLPHDSLSIYAYVDT